MDVLIIQQSLLWFGHSGALEFSLYPVPCLSAYFTGNQALRISIEAMKVTQNNDNTTHNNTTMKTISTTGCQAPLPDSLVAERAYVERENRLLLYKKHWKHAKLWHGQLH